jgi:excisionase family DNA binding protein
MVRRLLSVKQFAEVTGLSATTVYRMSGKGSIPTVRIGGRIRIPDWYLDQFTRQPGTLPSYARSIEGGVL